MAGTPEDRLLDAIERTAALTSERVRSGTGHDDADDEGGTIATDDAIGFDPLPLLGALDRHGAEVVVMGQVAGILHGSVELTGDLDLLWSGIPAQLAAMSAGFAAVDAELFDDDGRPLATTADAFTRPKVDFRSANASGDCCTPALPWGGLDIRAFLDRALSTTVAGVRLRFLQRSDLIAMRRAVGRPKDLRRAAELEALDR